MTFTVNATGISTPGGSETRDIIYLNVEYGANTYSWQWYMPQNSGLSIDDYVTSQATYIQADIDAKEANWAALGPNPTTTMTDMFTGETKTIPIDKTTVVCPTYPDYYALRKGEYPPLSDQIGALMSANTNPTVATLQQQIAAVKQKYPKPAWMTK